MSPDVAPLLLDVAGAVPALAPAARSGPLAHELDDLLITLANEPVARGDLASVLLGVAHGARTAGAGARPPAVSAAASAQATRAHARELSEALLAARIRYDAFFHLRRVRGLSVDALRVSVLDTVAGVLDDATDAAIGLAELIDLLQGVRALLAAVEPPVGSLGPRHARVQRRTSGRDTARRRWLLGHHLYALFSDFGGHHLARAAGAVGSGGHPDLAATAMAQATTFVRAASATLCYAATIPRALYLGDIRPLMDRASGTGHGFSGVDNLDYLLMREGWERLHELLGSAVPDPRATAAALRLFEAVVEDNERHTLAAAALVGTEPSLRQRHALAAIAGAAGVAAVEALRQNTDQRRELLESLAARAFRTPLTVSDAQ